MASGDWKVCEKNRNKQKKASLEVSESEVGKVRWGEEVQVYSLHVVVKFEGEGEVKKKESAKTHK